MPCSTLKIILHTSRYLTQPSNTPDFPVTDLHIYTYNLHIYFHVSNFKYVRSIVSHRNCIHYHICVLFFFEKLTSIRDRLRCKNRNFLIPLCIVCELWLTSKRLCISWLRMAWRFIVICHPFGSDTTRHYIKQDAFLAYRLWSSI